MRNLPAHWKWNALIGILFAVAFACWFAASAIPGDQPGLMGAAGACAGAGVVWIMGRKYWWRMP